MNKFREAFLAERENNAKALFEKIKNNTSPNIADLWALTEEYFIEWRKLNDFPKLLNHFDSKLLLFKEWKQDNKLTDELIITTGELTPFLEQKKLSKNKKLYLTKQVNDGKKRLFVAYTKQEGKRYFGKEVTLEFVAEFYSYLDWLKQRNKKQEILYINSRNAPGFDNERVFIHNDIYDTTNSDFELLKMGGIEAPKDGYGILLRGKRLEFVNLCGLRLSGEVLFGEEGNLSCSFCACDNMKAENLKMSLLEFENCSIMNLKISNSKIQQWRFYNCHISGDFMHSQFRHITVHNGQFNPVIKDCTLFGFEVEAMVPYNNSIYIKDELLECNSSF